VRVGEDAPRLVIRDNAPLLALLRAGQDLLWRDPAAARSIIQALVSEGRRFAQTPEGRHWKAELSTSELVEKGRLIWQAFGMDSFAEGAPSMAPSEWLDLITEALRSADLEATLSTLMVEEAVSGRITPA
jgi:hypothetical protein